jgi:diguanylate cyclase (GGDEF)-like protein
LISQSAKLEDVLKLITEKSRLLANSEVAYLLFRLEGQDDFSMKAVDGANTQEMLNIHISPREEIFAKVINANKSLVIDKQNILPPATAMTFHEVFKLKNTLALPVYLKGRVVAILGIGNTKEAFLYRKEDMEILDIFVKQVTIAIENDILMHRVEKLEIKDTLTGLYNEPFIRNRLQEEIRRAIAYQRPCSFVLFDIDNFKEFYHSFGSLQTETALKKIASLFRDSVTEIDRVGRVGDDEFALILPEKNKRKAQQVAEDIRKKIEFSFSEEEDSRKRLTISGGVSENPLDGVEAEELISKAKELRSVAKKRGKNIVVGFEEQPICP